MRPATWIVSPSALTSSGQVAEDRVVFQQVRERGRVRDVVHGHELELLVVQRGPKDVAPDAAEAIDTHADRHCASLSSSGWTGSEESQSIQRPRARQPRRLRRRRTASAVSFPRCPEAPTDHLTAPAARRRRARWRSSSRPATPWWASARDFRILALNPRAETSCSGIATPSSSAIPWPSSWPPRARARGGRRRRADLLPDELFKGEPQVLLGRRADGSVFAVDVLVTEVEQGRRRSPSPASATCRRGRRGRRSCAPPRPASGPRWRPSAKGSSSRTSPTSSPTSTSAWPSSPGSRRRR